MGSRTSWRGHSNNRFTVAIFVGPASGGNAATDADSLMSGQGGAFAAFQGNVAGVGDVNTPDVLVRAPEYNVKEDAFSKARVLAGAGVIASGFQALRTRNHRMYVIRRRLRTTTSSCTSPHSAKVLLHWVLNLQAAPVRGDCTDVPADEDPELATRCAVCRASRPLAGRVRGGGLRRRKDDVLGCSDAPTSTVARGPAGIGAHLRIAVAKEI